MVRKAKPKIEQAEILREYGPFPDLEHVRGVTFDGSSAWVAGGTHLRAFDPETGRPGKRLDVAADAGTACDGEHLYQITGNVIHKIDRTTGAILRTIPAPGGGRDSGMAWAEGRLWVGQHRDRKIHCIDPETGEILRTIESDRFVTGVSFVDGELWHATLEDDESELRRVEPTTGEVLERLLMPSGAIVSGLENDGTGRLLCGGGRSGKVRAVRRPRRSH